MWSLDLLREECFHMETRETAVQKRMFKRIKSFIVQGGGNKVRLSIGGKVVWGSLGKLTHFFPLVRRNSILKRQFEDVTPCQMERMTDMIENLLSAPDVKKGTLLELGKDISIVLFLGLNLILSLCYGFVSTRRMFFSSLEQCPLSINSGVTLLWHMRGKYWTFVTCSKLVGCFLLGLRLRISKNVR